MKRIISSIILVMMLFSVATTAFANDCYYYDAYGVHAYAQESFSYPTCTEPGYVVISCTVCGDSYREETGDAYGHSWYKAAEKPATCTEQGHIYYCCDECYGEKVENTKALGHKYNVLQVIETATCTSGGKEKVECTRCNQVTIRETGKTEHAYGEWQIIAEATDSSMGKRAKYCADCNYEFAEEFYPDGTLYRGIEDKEAVKVLQTMLTECGYLNDTIDGIFGKKTEQAVVDFQTQAGVEADGIAWPETYALIEKEWQILNGIYVEEEAVTSEYPCCIRIENEDGTVEFGYCAEHMIMMNAVEVLFEAENTEEMNVSALRLVRQMYEEDLDMLYAEWLELSPEEEKGNIIAAQAMFFGYLDAQENVWTSQYGENSAETLVRINDMLHNQWANLCGTIYYIAQ